MIDRDSEDQDDPPEELEDGASSIAEADVPYSDLIWSPPPVRSLICPDPGHILFDCDLSGADAQVVAWEAGDPAPKAAFRAGLDIHNFNGKRIWGEAYNPDLVRRKLTWRDECKRGVHGTNYLASVRELARVLRWTTAEVSAFQRAHFGNNPGIEDWHRRTEREVAESGTISNIFGYSITYFDRPSNVLPKALAWKPQSTIANTTEKGAVQLDANVPWCEVLLQVHDSVIFQLPFHRHNSASMRVVYDHLQITIPYPDPLVIPWGLASSTENWQRVKKQKWEDIL